MEGNERVEDLEERLAVLTAMAFAKGWPLLSQLRSQSTINQERGLFLPAMAWADGGREIIRKSAGAWPKIREPPSPWDLLSDGQISHGSH